MSGTPSNEETRITMGRWLNTYAVAAGPSPRHAAILDVVQRVDRCVAEDLPASCRRSLRHRLDGPRPEVWRIRNLHLNFVLDVSAPGAGDVAQRWGDRVAARILEIIGRGAASDEVLCFPNRAVYLARFAIDLVAGRAWGKWYYEEFHSLEMLAAGRAISSAFAREPEQGMRAILHLAESGRLDEILFVLTETDARAIYEQCFASQEIGHSPKDLSRWSGRLLDVWDQEPKRPPSVERGWKSLLDRKGDAKEVPRSAEGSDAVDLTPVHTASTAFLPNPVHDALRWLVRGALRFPGAEQDPAACAAVDGLLELRRVLAAIRSPIVVDRLVRDLAQQNISIEEAVGIALKEGAVSPENALRFLAHVATGDPGWAAQAIAVLLRDQAPAAQPPSANESTITPFGGIFLIGPVLVGLNLKEIAEAAAGDGDKKEETAAFVRHTVLARCVGSLRAPEAIADPAFRLLSGCYRPRREEGSQALAPPDLARAREIFFSNLAWSTGCEGRCLLADAIRLPREEGEVLLLRDVARNAWIYASVLSSETAGREEALIAGLDLVRGSTGNLPNLLLSRSFARLAESPALKGRAERLLVIDRDEVGSDLLDVLSFTQCISASTQQEKVSHLLAPPDQEFGYFSLRGFRPDFDIALDLFGALLARAALKGFARRLMGFQSSSPEHLFRNFLAGVGTVRSLPERIEVELPHSPLSLVLQLSGLSRQTYVVPWLEGSKPEGREICLLPPRE
jgi:hypothetical protein